MLQTRLGLKGEEATCQPRPLVCPWGPPADRVFTATPPEGNEAWELTLSVSLTHSRMEQKAVVREKPSPMPAIDGACLDVSSIRFQLLE